MFCPVLKYIIATLFCKHVMYFVGLSLRMYQFSSQTILRNIIETSDILYC